VARTEVDGEDGGEGASGIIRGRTDLVRLHTIHIAQSREHRTQQ
jgi:hypothetical protein